MNIRKYMQAHESFIRESLDSEPIKERAGLKHRHHTMTARMQHERLIHLLVTLAFGLFLLIALTAFLLRPSFQLLILAGLFFLLLIPYIMHYYFLENTIQRWYTLTDVMDRIS